MKLQLTSNSADEITRDTLTPRLMRWPDTLTARVRRVWPMQLRSWWSVAVHVSWKYNKQYFVQSSWTPSWTPSWTQSKKIQCVFSKFSFQDPRLAWYCYRGTYSRRSHLTYTPTERAHTGPKKISFGRKVYSPGRAAPGPVHSLS